MNGMRSRNFFSCAGVFILIYLIEFLVCARGMNYTENICSQFTRNTSESILPCESIGIYKVDDLKLLCPCSVIDGNLQIWLLNLSDMIDVTSFPALKEITGYLSIYEVSGLKSLKTLFPSLAVIRGEKLVRKYSVVIINNNDLVDSSLPALRHIGSGFVFDSARTMNRLRTSSQTSSPNKLEEFEDLDEDKSASSTSFSHRSYNLECSSNCPNNCNSDGKCCHSECYGGCTSPSNISSCTACRNVKYGDQCLPKCPSPLYKVNHFCFERKECVSRNLLINDDTQECLRQLFCPDGYRKVGDNSLCPNSEEKHHLKEKLCVPCENKTSCPKVCRETFTIESVEDAVKLQQEECSVIEGALIINGNAKVNESVLEQSLANVREVRDYIHVSNSPNWLNLKFLKGIQVIGGKNLFAHKYAFFVEYLTKLETIFEDGSTDADRQTENHFFQINNGKILFKSTPQLCPMKVWSFVKGCERKSSENRGVTERDTRNSLENSTRDPPDFHPLPWQGMMLSNVSSNASCGVVPLDAWVEQSTSVGTLRIHWKSIALGLSDADFSKAVLFVVFYTEAPNDAKFKNYLGSSCDQEWKRKERIFNESESNQHNYIDLTNLTSHTRYAIQVQALPLEKGVNRYKAESEVLYNVTRPSKPSEPRNIRVVSNTPNSFHVSWDSPFHPNGVIDHYIISLKRKTQIAAFDDDYFDVCPMYVKNKFTTYKTWQKRQKQTQMQQQKQQQNNQLPIEFEVSNTGLLNSYPASLLEAGSQRNAETSIFFASGRPSSPFSFTDNGVNDESLDQVINFREVGLNHYNLLDYSVSSVMDQQIANDIDFDLKAEKLTKSRNRTSDVVKRYSTNIEVESLMPLQIYEIKIVACHQAFPCEKQITSHENLYSESNSNGKYKMCKLCSAGFGSATVMPNDRELKHQISMFLSNGTEKDNLPTSLNWVTPQHNNSQAQVLAYIIELKEHGNHKLAKRKCVPHKNGGVDYSVNLGDLTDHTPGNYSAIIRVLTVADLSEPLDIIDFVYEVPPRSQSILVAKILGLITLGEIFLAVIAYIAWKRYQPSHWISNRYNDEQLSDIVDDLQDIMDKIRDNLILSADQINVNEKKFLGHGHFGKVFEGVLEKGGVKEKVAIKVQDAMEWRRFRQEVLNMQDMNCTHVISLIGVVIQQRFPPMYVMELMENGDLESFIRRNKGTLSEQLLLKWAIQAADGMAFISSRPLVHRDVAARNCLLDSSLTLKIADLGLAELPCLHGNQRGLLNLPIRWMAPESLRSNEFTNRSDVWSFAVLLWEMSTGCVAHPYKGLKHKEVKEGVVKGTLTIRIPPTAILPFKKIMKLCWNYEPRKRPSFMTIVELLLESLPESESEHFENTSFYHGCLENQIVFGTPPGSESGFLDRQANDSLFSASSSNPSIQIDHDIEKGSATENEYYMKMYSYAPSEYENVFPNSARNDDSKISESDSGEQTQYYVKKAENSPQNYTKPGCLKDYVCHQCPCHKNNYSLVQNRMYDLTRLRHYQNYPHKKLNLTPTKRSYSNDSEALELLLKTCDKLPSHCFICQCKYKSEEQQLQQKHLQQQQQQQEQDHHRHLPEQQLLMPEQQQQELDHSSRCSQRDFFSPIRLFPKTNNTNLNQCCLSYCDCEPPANVFNNLNLNTKV